MPLLFGIKDLPVEERYIKVKEVSSLTHAHFRSVFACFIYLEFALQILQGNTIDTAYQNMQRSVKSFSVLNNFNPTEILLFQRILDADIRTVSEDKIHSGGYVLHTLEAALWCLLNTDNYYDAVLKAVNLGGDTDTTACVTGGLAGLLYGYNEILSVWVTALARKSDIDNLCERLFKSIQ